MKTFDNLENIWQSQPAVPVLTANQVKQQAETQAKKIKAKHYWTIAIIGITAIIVMAYFIWVAAYKHNGLFIGLGIMITMLLLRMAVEYISIKKLNTLNNDIPLLAYAAQLSKFYQWRKKIHFILTPIVYGLYITGFITLLPVFKANLSTGFFTYIVVSGIIVFIVLGVIIMRQIKKELTILTALNKNFAHTTVE
jgi:hypothetical protein